MKKYFKPILAFTFVLFYRLLPVRPPNVEPILGTIMPLSKKYGILSGVIFSVVSIVLYDALTAGIGSYTWTTALAYSLVSLGAGLYLANRQSSIKNFVTVSVVGIIFYDVVTGVVLGPLVTGASAYTALIGQIPFTALHLMGGAVFAIVLSPILSRWFETESVKVPELSKVKVLG
jgi:uncharacterized membrane protein